MPSASIPQLLTIADTDGAALANTTTQTSIIPAMNKWTFPACWLQDQRGKKLKIKAFGRISIVNPSPGTLLFQVMMGPSSSIAVFNSAAFNLNTTAAKTNVTWDLDIDLILRTAGSGTTAAFMGRGFFTSEAVIGSPANTAGGNGSLLLPVSAPAVGTGFDSSVANVLDLQAKWGTASASNSMTLHGYELWAEN